MTTLLKAKPIVEAEINKLQKRCEALKQQGIIPYLKVFLVGENPASLVYTKNKKIFCEKFGAKCDIIRLPENISEQDFLAEVEAVASDKEVHGALIQLPLPNQLSDLPVGDLIPAHKDVDGFHKDNIASLFRGEPESEFLTACTPKGVMTLLEAYDISLSGKSVAIIGRSLIVGKPLSLLMTTENATVTLCHSRTPNIQEVTKNSDIIVCATGQTKFFDSSYINSNKNQVVIDVGINRDEQGNLCGDVDFDDVFEHVQAITPVPGGVGPMTILSIGQNLLQAAEKTL